MEAVAQEVSYDFKTKTRLSVRVKPGLKGLPGSDPTESRLTIGSSIRGRAPLSGLNPEEEKLYLPSIIAISPNDNMWSNRVSNYWKDISQVVPFDGTTTEDLPGKVLEFEIGFPTKVLKDAYEKEMNFKEKGEISKRGKCTYGIADFILFRYCLEYGRVANSLADIYATPKIRFYLYSKAAEVSAAHITMQTKVQATTKFAEIVTNPVLVDALLRMFKQIPEVLGEDEARHMALFGFAESQPSDFLKYANDKTIAIKAAILKATDMKIIYRPENTDSYYYGDNQEVRLGSSLEDAVLWFKNATEGTNLNVKEAIKAALEEKG
jgi:hypothetical protein